MYTYCPPKPIEIPLKGKDGYALRVKASEFVKANPITRGPRKGSVLEQKYGALAEIVVRNQLRMPDINPKDHPKGYDFKLENDIKIDVKCRGGKYAFSEKYMCNDGIERDAKHNLFAEQVFDESLDADIYLMTHLRTAGKKGELPGTDKERNWRLYICGWVSKNRVKKEGVYLPRGSISERGDSWFAYRAEEIEFYNKFLNGLEKLDDILKIDKDYFERDKTYQGNLNLTSADAIRITIDLMGRGVLSEKHLTFIKGQTNVTRTVKPILHPNQYFHLLKWLKNKGEIGGDEFKKINLIMTEQEYKPKKS